MADLSIMTKDTTLGRIDEAIEAKERATKPRLYLGMSALGDPCERRLWFNYHLRVRQTFEARVLRIFDTGHIIERRIVRDLKKAGIKVTGRQLKFRDFKNKFRGHCDGVVEGLPESGVPHILEIKSANGKNFKKILKEGVHQPQYLAQVQLYMGYGGFERALFIVECKDTSARYMERIHFDVKVFNQLKNKAKSILELKVPPRGISEREDWWECRFCHLNNDEYCRKVEEGGTPF